MSLQRVLVRSLSTFNRFHTAQQAQSTPPEKKKRPRRFESPVEVDDSYADEHIFNEDHIALRRTLRKIIDTEINPYVDEWEEAGAFPAHKVFKVLGDVGFLGVNKEEQYGGLGLDFSYTIAVHEEMSHIRCGGIPMAIGVQADMCTPALSRHGSDELKRLFLAPNIAGDMVGCVGVSEVDAGSDVAAIKTTAVKSGDDYVINGGKMWTTNGRQADWMCLLANTSEGPVHANKTLICVPMDTPGITRLSPLKKLGMRSSDTIQTFFEDVRVPQKYAIGREGKGFVYQMEQFQDERLVGAISPVTMLAISLQETAKACYDRKIFGRPVLDNQTVHFRLAEIATEVECLRSLIYRATGQYVNGKDVTLMASMAKLKAGRLVREGTDSLLQFWGGQGYLDCDISRRYRDGRLLSIGGGADEVMLSIICKYMDIFPK